MHHLMQSINDRVAYHINVFRDALPAQVLPAFFRGGKVQGCHAAGQHPVHFLWERRILVIGAETCLHVSHSHLMVEGCQCRRRGRGGIPVHQGHIRLHLVEHRIQAFQHTGGDGGQGLPGVHQVQVIVRGDAKLLHHTVQHLTMLGSNAYHAFDALCLFKALDQRSHFDGFRPCAENAQYR